MTQDTRIAVQSNATGAIIACCHNGIIDVSPRVGKSKILIDSIRSYKDWNVVISSPYTSIQDSWEYELQKWNIPYNVITICSKSLKKIDDNIDLLVVDEIQTLSEAQIDTIIDKKPKRIIGLTGTLSEETKLLLKRRLKLRSIFTYSIEQAINDNIISNFEINVIRCRFSPHLRVDSGTKARPTKVSEAEHAKYLHNQYNKFRMLSYSDSSMESIKQHYIRKRVDLIYNSPTKALVAKEIIDQNERCIVFTARQDKAEYLCSHTHHSKNKKEGNLDKFINGTVNKLGVVEMVNMGITIDNLKCAVVHQLKSSSEMSLQKILRVCNLEDDKLARIYITVFRDSVDEEWTMKALENVKKERIKIIDV